MDRANDVWIGELRQPGPRREAALVELRADLLRGLLRWRAPGHGRCVL